YADVLEETGSYVYAVYAVKADGSMSAPAYCTVEVDFTGVAENQNVNVSVYPNPANDMFTINVNADNFKYQLVNSLGQVVYSGNASNKAVVSVSELNKGVYFLRITTGNQVKTQKVVVE
ncbi:MAG: T9SS type A sorting domain-containing protein, partial [Bacteroidales bacterium]|nr:T9SS type A sorting domain-containing protein [Bacteroidales bacterium]